MKEVEDIEEQMKQIERDRNATLVTKFMHRMSDIRKSIVGGVSGGAGSISTEATPFNSNPALLETQAIIDKIAKDAHFAPV